MDKIEELLTRGVANIIPNKAELQKSLKSGKKLNIYLGIDPTATKIHLGHAVPIRKLQALANLGHHVTFLIGDFTALIGDTSDKESERPALSQEEIKENFKTYKEQAEKILDFSRIKIRHNSEWLKNLSFQDIIKLTQHFSLGDFISRELIKKRLTNGSRVGLHEVLYPVMQGYDSHYMDTDLQIGAADQTFNMQAGRTLIKDLHNKESFILAVDYLSGTDGRKMSKTWGNAIWLDDSPEDMYGKVMSLKDELIIEYFTLATNATLEKIEEISKRLKKDENPMAIKKELAYEIVRELYDENKAREAENYFEKAFQKGETPEDIPNINIKIQDKISVSDILLKANLVSSKTEAKRLIEQGGVEIEGKRINNPLERLEKGNYNVRIGRKFAKITIG
ncbi:tyrosine--tRNA ligase [Candidatus Parcubacteria bacterium]|nr:MAG: tyrosine--tRNA ligase [Candidatus Parcubacteria bacterium]